MGDWCGRDGRLRRRFVVRPELASLALPPLLLAVLLDVCGRLPVDERLRLGEVSRAFLAFAHTPLLFCEIDLSPAGPSGALYKRVVSTTRFPMTDGSKEIVFEKKVNFGRLLPFLVERASGHVTRLDVSTLCGLTEDSVGPQVLYNERVAGLFAGHFLHKVGPHVRANAVSLRHLRVTCREEDTHPFAPDSVPLEEVFRLARLAPRLSRLTADAACSPEECGDQLGCGPSRRVPRCVLLRRVVLVDAAEPMPRGGASPSVNFHAARRARMAGAPPPPRPSLGAAAGALRRRARCGHGGGPLSRLKHLLIARVNVSTAEEAEVLADAVTGRTECKEEEKEAAAAVAPPPSLAAPPVEVLALIETRLSPACVPSLTRLLRHPCSLRVLHIKNDPSNEWGGCALSPSSPPPSTPPLLPSPWLCCAHALPPLPGRRRRARRFPPCCPSPALMRRLSPRPSKAVRCRG